MLALCVTVWRSRLVRALGRAIASVALLSLTTSCGSSRTVTRESRDRVATYEARDSFTAERVVVMDTVNEVTTITVDRNEAGDTVRVSTVTDRLRGRSRDAIAVQKTKTEVRVDTIYIEKRDSVEIRSRPSVGGGQSGKTALHTTLKWVFWIIVAVIALIIVIRIRGYP